MILINFLFAFKMVHSKVFDEIANEKRMVPMFESTVPVSSLVNYKLKKISKFQFLTSVLQLDLVNGYTDNELVEMIKLLSGESNPEEVMTLKNLL